MRAFARNTRNIFLTVILTTFLTAAPSGTLNFVAKFDKAGNPTANSIISDNGTKVGIGTLSPAEVLEVNGRIKSGVLTIGPWPANPNRYTFFGANALNQSDVGNYALLQAAADVDKGVTYLNSPVSIHFRIGNAEKMALANNGNIGIGTMDPTQRLDVASTIRSSSGGFMFPDGTTQTTATLRGPQGPQGPVGTPGPAVKTVAVCSPGGTGGCACNNRTVTRQFGRCTVTSETGSCFSGEANGCCAVCAP